MGKLIRTEQHGFGLVSRRLLFTYTIKNYHNYHFIFRDYYYYSLYK